MAAELDSLNDLKMMPGEVRKVSRCGISLENYNDILVGDQLEVCKIVETPKSSSFNAKRFSRSLRVADQIQRELAGFAALHEIKDLRINKSRLSPGGGQS